MGKKSYVSVEKLITHLGPRDEYVLHYSELQYYVKLGMVVDEVQKVLSFDQSPWLEPYISLNSNLRKKARNDFERDFFKLMNNSVYGKTMENVRKHIDIKLLPLRNKKDEKSLLNKIRKPSFKYARLLGKDLVGVHMGKSEVTLNKPILVGAAVLGLSKLHMYQFWYDYVKATYGEKATLCYMDTDSFIYGVETEDIYQDMIKNADLFDFSNYPPDHPLVKSIPEDQWIIDENGEQTLKNAGVIGKFKYECPDYIMSEFFGIRAKLYHYVLENGSVGSRHKGVSKMGMENTARNNMPIAANGEQYDPMTLLYRECLFGEKQIYAKNVGFRTKDHIISLVEVEKQAASPFDDKRWILSDGKRTLPYEHWRIGAFYHYLNTGMSQEKAEQWAMYTTQVCITIRMEDNSLVTSSTITWKDIERAQIKIIDSALRARYKKDSKFIKEYVGYVKKLRKEEKPNEYVRTVAMMLFPNEESYKKRIKRYREWYENKKEILESVENLYNLYYELSKEERIITEEDISNTREDLLRNDID
ncbi:hypothetical protein RhiirC2_717220 [Rhizophagus irregularis]|uniref:DNA-directed DNA polymerase n=1 Tax=Rhizophagus irregularis TaxID=588596 RepID=A0A2N1MN77_9GLOM|nr:hypothetical protein RhiirC2_717220 [Rhizophagus irregularis]